MIIPTIVGPITILYVLGVPGLFAIAVSGGILATYLAAEDVHAGELGPGEYFAAGAATAFVAAYVSLFAYMNYWAKIETYFSTFPWLSYTNARQAKEGTRQYHTKCPFTALRPTARCPSCQVRIHESAFHNSDKFLDFPTEATVLRWENAKKAIDTEGSTEEIAKARSALDEAIDFRGNQFFNALCGCCIGCATWQRCFNLAPRLSLTFALTSLFYAYVPWAFATFLQLVGQTAGSILQIISGTVAGGFACAALLIQIQALLKANAFMAKYQDKIPAMKPLFNPPTSWLGRTMYRALSGAPWSRNY